MDHAQDKLYNIKKSMLKLLDKEAEVSSVAKTGKYG